MKISIEDPYTRNRKWADKLLPQAIGICSEVFREITGSNVTVKIASEEMDYKEATDLVVLKIGSILRVACRIRSFSAYASFPDQFTIRSGLPSGGLTEMHKIVDGGWGDYLFYGFANATKTKIISWFIGNLDIFRWQYRHARKVMAQGFNLKRIRWIEKTNEEDQIKFCAFYLTDFPPEFVVAHHNNSFVPGGPSASLGNPETIRTEPNTRPPNPKKFFAGKAFVPRHLAAELMDRYAFANVGGELFVYRDGTFKANGEVWARKQCRMYLGDSSRTSRVNEVIEHITDMSLIDPGTLNRHPELINLTNGMYNWVEDVVVAHDPKYLSTVQLPVVFDPKANCPEIDRFIRTTVPADCVRLIEELLGYCLMPDVRFEKAFMIVGPGANGKSKFLKMLTALVGHDNISNVPLQELDGNRFKRADLLGKLVNTFADLDGKALDGSAYFKAAVSGDYIDAERKHADPFYFKPTAKFIFSCNYIPASPDRSYAFYRRWCIIPFPNQFEGETADKAIEEKITRPRELSGLLNLALAGLRRLFRNNEFTESETTARAMSMYRLTDNSADAFIGECLAAVNNARTIRTDVYKEYERFCQRQKLQSVSRIDLYRRVKSATGAVVVQGDRGVMFFKGLTFVPSLEQAVAQKTVKSTCST